MASRHLVSSSPCWLLLLTAAASVASGCSGACEARSQLRRLSLDHIKQQILLKLGLERAPNVTGRPLPNIPPLEDLYDRMEADQPLVEDHDQMEASVEKVIAFAQPQAKMRHWRGKELLYFRFSEKTLEARVLSATLYLWARPAAPTSSNSNSGTGPGGGGGVGQDDAGPLVLSLYKLTSSEPPLLLPFDSRKEARPRGGGRWIKIDVKRLVSDWFKSNPESMGLAVQASVPGRELSTQRLIALSSNSETSQFVPFLEVRIVETRKERQRRNIGLNCPEENSEETRCCRYPLTVDFEEFGWDWIIAPKQYEANYCAGECPMVFLPKYPHTHIVHLANPSGTSGPCCAPRKMSSISMLYFDPNFNIIYGLLPGMVVDRCGCS